MSIPQTSTQGLLRLKNEDYRFIYVRKPKLPRKSKIHGPARLLELRTNSLFKMGWGNSSSKSNAARDRFSKIGDIFRKPQLDLVFAIKHPSWPNVAVEWIRRKPRFLSNALVTDIIKRGCHLVEKSHPSTLNCTSEWRFSFSVAETILIKRLEPQACIMSTIF